MRELSESERQIVQQFAEALPENVGRHVRADLDKAQVDRETNDRALVRFRIDGYTRPDYRGQHPYPVEGTLRDEDGAVLQVILHADENDRLLELEIIRWEPGPLLSPDWTSFRVAS